MYSSSSTVAHPNTSLQMFQCITKTPQEPRPPAKSQGTCQALLSSAKADESLQKVRQQGNGLKMCEEQPGDEVSVLQPGRPMAWDLLSQGVAECFRAGRMRKTSGSTDPTDLTSSGEEEDDESVKLKKYFSWWEAGHNGNEWRDSSPGPGKKCDRYGTGQ